MGLKEIIQKLENDREYLINYKPPPYIRKGLAEVLREGEFRTLAELLTKALGDWLRDRELKVVYKREKRI
jgi:hypothetical protein